MSTFDVSTFNIKEFDRILACGLSRGLGSRGQQVCVEAAICQVLNLPHMDDPGCVARSVRSFKITLNDSSWSTAKARAEGLRDLGLAQLGSKGVVEDREFTALLSKKVVQVLIPALFREIFPNNKACLEAALRCEQEGTEEAANSAANSAASWAASAAASAASWANSAARWAALETLVADPVASAARWAAMAAATAATAALSNVDKDKYLKLGASLALGVLKELKSPGCQLL